MVVTGMRQTQGEVGQCGSDWYEADTGRGRPVVVTGMRQTQGEVSQCGGDWYEADTGRGQPVWW